MAYSKRIILDLCGGTGSWSKPYREDAERYRVKLITLPHYDVTKVTIEKDSIIFHAQTFGRKDIVVPVHRVHGILAAPPCTIFSIARQVSHEIRRPFAEAMIVVEACERIIRHCKAFGYLKWWAMENPRGYLRQFLGIPKFTFEAWQFGDYWLKPTDIWGYFKQPVQTHFDRPTYQETQANGTSVRAWNPVAPKGFEHIKNTSENRAVIRAITPPGFAQAFYKANR